MAAHTASSNGRKLTLTALAQAKSLPADFLRELGLKDLPDGGVGIPYYDPTGWEIAVKRRTALKAKDGSYWPKGMPLAAYGQWKLGEASRAGILALFEGESDCWVLWHHSLPALGLPGANTVKKALTRAHLDGIEKLYVHREPDRGGEQFVASVATRLGELGFTGRAFELRMPDGIKDPADLHTDDPTRFLERLETAISAASSSEIFLIRSRTEAREENGQLTPEPSPWETPIHLAKVADAEPFPLDTLPLAVARFIEGVASAKNCPADYVAVPLLAVAGAAIGASRALEIKAGWRERPCIYAAVIGPPGSVKTPALKSVAGPVYAEQSRRLADYRRLRIAWQEGEEKGTPPLLETVYVSDITVEKLAVILQDNPRGVCLIRDELTGWIGGMDQYRAKGKGADRQAFLSIWAGEPIRVDRKGEQEPVYVPHPLVNVIGGLPPAMLPRLRGERGVWDGFLDRVLLSYPAPLPAKGEDWMCVDQLTAEDWEVTLKRLWDLKPESTDDQEVRPRYVRLTTEGRRAWETFTAQLAAAMNRDDLPEAIKGHLAKFKGYCARLALIVHCLRMACLEVSDEDVDGEDVNRAGRLVRYFHSHAQKVHDALGSDPGMEAARHVLKWLRTEYREYSENTPLTLSRRDIHQGNRRRFKTADEIDPVIKVLVQHYYLRPRGSGRPGRGHSSPTYEVNPALFAPDSETPSRTHCTQ